MGVVGCARLRCDELYNFFLRYPVICTICGPQYMRTLRTQKLNFDAISRESGFFCHRNVQPKYVLARSRFSATLCKSHPVHALSGETMVAKKIADVIKGCVPVVLRRS